MSRMNDEFCAALIGLHQTWNWEFQPFSYTYVFVPFIRALISLREMPF